MLVYDGLEGSSSRSFFSYFWPNIFYFSWNIFYFSRNIFYFLEMYLFLKKYFLFLGNFFISREILFISREMFLFLGTFFYFLWNVSVSQEIVFISRGFGRPFCKYVDWTGKIKWVHTRYEPWFDFFLTWFDFFLTLFMSGHKRDKRYLKKSSFKAKQVLHQLISEGGHLYPLINKDKQKSNKVSYLVSTHLIFPFSYAFFISWINKTLKLDWCKTCRMLIVGVINLCKGNFMPCIFYINTLKLSLYTETSQIY